MIPWWSIPLAVVFGAMVGLCIMAACAASGRADECDRCQRVLDALAEARRCKLDEPFRYVEDAARYGRVAGALLKGTEHNTGYVQQSNSVVDTSGAMLCDTMRRMTADGWTFGTEE